MASLPQRSSDVNSVYTINEPAARGAYQALSAKGLAAKVKIASIDGGCQGVQDVKDGKYLATVMQFPKKMAEMGVDAVVKFAKDAATTYDPAKRTGAKFGPAENVVDKSGATVWDVTVPADGRPIGAGVMVDLGKLYNLRALKISTPTAGFEVEIYGAASAKPEDLPEDVLDKRWEHLTTIKSVVDDKLVSLLNKSKKQQQLLLFYVTMPKDLTDPRVAIGKVTVAGVPVTVDEKGVRASGTTVLPPGATDPVTSALGQAPVHISLTSPVKKAGRGEVECATGPLVIAPPLATVTPGGPHVVPPRSGRQPARGGTDWPSSGSGATRQAPRPAATG